MSDTTTRELWFLEYAEDVERAVDDAAALITWEPGPSTVRQICRELGIVLTRPQQTLLDFLDGLANRDGVTTVAAASDDFPTTEMRFDGRRGDDEHPIEPEGKETCPCGNELERWIDNAIGVCTHCRSEAHKKIRKAPRRKPTFTDVPIPGLEEWGA